MPRSATKARLEKVTAEARAEVDQINGEDGVPEDKLGPRTVTQGAGYRRPAAFQALGPARRARSSSSMRNDTSSRRTPIRARVTSLGSQVVIALARACVVG